MSRKINNMPSDHERYVVVRLVDGELWYWGSWSEYEPAANVAYQFVNGLVVDSNEL